MSCRVFYVDDQEDIVWSTTRLLARNCPNLDVESFTDPTTALEALRKAPPDILVTDLRMEGMSGLELMVAARKVVPDLPVIVVTAYGGPGLTAALRGRSLVEYLEKPIRTELLVASIDRLLVRSDGFSGAIRLPMLPDLVQVYTLSQTTGALSIRRGTSSGTIWFDQGQIVHAVCGQRLGETAVYELLSWQGGEFHLDTHARATEKTITASWQEVLLEGCRLLDEDGRGAALGDDISSLSEALEDSDNDIPSSQVQVPVDLVQSAPPEVSQAAPPPTRHETSMQTTLPPGKADQELKTLAQLEGFICTAILDDTVQAFLCHPAHTAADLEATMADNVSILRHLHATADGLNGDDAITDVVFTLQRQYSLIRPLHQGGTHCLCLVLDRKHSDLAKARTQMAEVRERLQAVLANSATRFMDADSTTLAAGSEG